MSSDSSHQPEFRPDETQRDKLSDDTVRDQVSGDETDDNALDQVESSRPDVMPIAQSADEVESTIPATPSTAAMAPGWLHPTSLMFELLAHIRRYLIPAIFALVIASNGSTFGFVLAIGIFVPALFISVFRYFTLRYQIRDGDLIVSEGLLFRRVRTVPVKRIQNIDLLQNVLHRLLRVAEVRVETASGTRPEATLRVLSMKNVEVLRRGVFAKQQHDAKSTPEEAAAPEELVKPPTSQTILEIPTQWLVRAGLASNRGMLIVGIVAGLFFQFDLEDRINREQLEQFIPQTESNLIMVVGIIAAVVLILILLRLFGVIWYLLRFHGYRLTQRENDLRISCGLLTKVSATVPKKRIQFISIHRTFIMRWLGLASIRIETAGGSGSGNEDASESVSKRWFIPVVPEHRVSELVTILRPGLDWDESGFDWKPLAAKAKLRLIRISVLLSILLMVAGGILARAWIPAIGVLCGATALPLLVWWAIKKSRAMRYARTDYGVVYRSGVLNRRTSVTFFEKIQALRVGQTPFDRRWKMAKLSIDTAAAGPAEHRIAVPYLDEGFARDEYDEIVQQAAVHQPVYG